MNHLHRNPAPIAESGWKQIDGEAKERLTVHLAARRVVDLSGPHGWDHSSMSLGRSEPRETPASFGSAEITARQRTVLPLLEFRVPFTVSRVEVDDAERGAVDLDFDSLDDAAAEAALIENRTVFHGWPDAGIVGATQASAHRAEHLGEDAEQYPSVVATAVETLRCQGIGGPYGLVIGPAGYARIVETTEHGGYLLLDHLRRVLGGGSVVRSTGVDGALVLGLGGGDFILELGQDFSVGYSHHDADAVHLYLEESFTFRVTEPDAVLALTE
jgi:uncharacterized linocin/CFP29 family protein